MYKITIGTYVDDTVHPNRCLFASVGGKGIAVKTLPWESTGRKPWDYKFLDGNFILDPIPEKEAVQTVEEKIDNLENIIADLCSQMLDLQVAMLANTEEVE